MVETGLSKLNVAGEKKRYKTTKDEIVEYLYYMEGDLSRPLSNMLLGHQLRKRRNELKMSAMDLAEAINTDANTLTAVERGDDGVSLDRLKKLSKVLSVSAGYFLGDDNQKAEESDPFILSVKAHMTGATESDKDFALKAIQLMMEARKLKQ